MGKYLINGKKIKLTWVEAVLGLIALAQFAFVCFVNLTRIPATLDNDSAKIITHAVEIFRTGQIFIPNWVNETMLELDTTLLPALLFYGITGDIFVSFGLGNILILLAFDFFFVSILRRMRQSLSVQLITCGLLSIPYSFGQLLYFDMMFFAGGFYGLKVLLPVMIVWLLTTPSGKRKVGFYIVMVITTGLSLICGISTGPYILICGILPIVICYVWFAIGNLQTEKELISKWLINPRSLILYAQGIANLLGIYINLKKNVDSTGTSMKILSIYDFIDNAFQIVSGFFETFGSYPYKEVAATSIAGIGSAIRFLIAILALIAVIGIIKKYFKNLRATVQLDPTQAAPYYFIMGFLVNLFVLLMCPVEACCRYLLMGLFPMFPLVVIYYKDFLLFIQSRVQRSALLFGAFTVIILTTGLSDVAVLKDECYPEMASTNRKYEHILPSIDSSPRTQVFLLNDMGMTETLRALDYKSGREYLTYMTTKNGVFVHDYYEDHTETSVFNQRHYLIIDEHLASLDELPVYMQNLYEPVDSYQNLHLYVADVNPMDGVAGFAMHKDSIDYPYTPGYTVYYGEFKEDGRLYAEGTGEVCVSSPYMGYADSLDITVECEVLSSGENAGRVVIWNGDTHEEIASKNLEPGEIEVSFEALSTGGAGIVVQVEAAEQAQVAIGRFLYSR